MRKISITFAAAMAATVAVGASCSTLGRAAFEQPVVQLSDVRFNGAGLTGGSLDVILSVYNPNEFRLDATRLTYNVLVDTASLATGTLDGRFTVQADDSTTVVVPVSFTYAGLGAAGRELMNTGSVNYRVLGDVVVATPLGNFTVPYDRTGRFSTLGGIRE
ncbi:MAG: LEA type 2 family protein [Gemmatimonadaceae bacterium]